MENHRIESWALSVLSRTLEGYQTEDTRVELKRTWPKDVYAAARRIAGHANAARREPILWLIGIDEEARALVGAPQHEFASWWAQVRSVFDGVAPTLCELAIAHEGVSVMALFFETDRAPFGVTNADGGRISVEVPWRDGTAIRTARREDLLKILAPAARVPEHEVLDVTVQAVKRHDHRGTMDVGHLQLELYLTGRTEEPVFIPFHRCDGRFRLGNSDWVELERVGVGVAGVPLTGDGALRAITCDRHQAKLIGSAKVELYGDFPAHAVGNLQPQAWSGEQLELIATVRFAGTDAPMRIEQRFRRAGYIPDGRLGLWRPKDG